MKLYAVSEAQLILYYKRERNKPPEVKLFNDWDELFDLGDGYYYVIQVDRGKYDIPYSIVFRVLVGGGEIKKEVLKWEELPVLMKYLVRNFLA